MNLWIMIFENFGGGSASFVQPECQTDRFDDVPYGTVPVPYPCGTVPYRRTVPYRTVRYGTGTV